MHCGCCRVPCKEDVRDVAEGVVSKVAEGDVRVASQGHPLLQPPLTLRAALHGQTHAPLLPANGLVLVVVGVALHLHAGHALQSSNLGRRLQRVHGGLQQRHLASSPQTKRRQERGWGSG